MTRHDLANAAQIALLRGNLAALALREGLSARHTRRLQDVRDNDTAPIAPDVDDALINAGLLEVLPDGSVQVSELYAAQEELLSTAVEGEARLCDCTESGRSLPLIGCPHCRGEGVIR